jgi:cation diffusion facilitator CzcD-associated flavoprotein CzcO
VRLEVLNLQHRIEARHGRAAYAALVRIPRDAWAEYLAWYRNFLDIPVRYHARLVHIEPGQGHFRLHLETASGMTVETARKIILANGVGGTGGPYIPAVLSEGLPRQLYAHTADRIDFVIPVAARGKKAGDQHQCAHDNHAHTFNFNNASAFR